MKTLDLTGQRFGKLVAVKRVENDGKRSQWLCQCDCGNMAVIRTEYLRSGDAKSCGCENFPKDLTGMTFHRLTVLEFFENKNNRNYWKCRCECGNIINASTNQLKSGHTKSCGCFRSDTTKIVHKKHGKKHIRLYKTWCGMKARCNNPNEKSYIDYGKRGISVCIEWENDFSTFYDWAMDNGYKDNLTIDRINTNGNYCPENCRWITKAEQANNTRRNIMIEFLGINKSLKQWTDYMGWQYTKYNMRHHRGNPIFDENEKTLIEEKLRSEKNYG